MPAFPACMPAFSCLHGWLPACHLALPACLAACLLSCLPTRPSPSASSPCHHSFKQPSPTCTLPSPAQPCRCPSTSLKHKTLAQLGKLLMRQRGAVAAILARKPAPPGSDAAAAAARGAPGCSPQQLGLSRAHLQRASAWLGRVGRDQDRWARLGAAQVPPQLPPAAAAACALQPWPRSSAGCTGWAAPFWTAFTQARAVGAVPCVTLVFCVREWTGLVFVVVHFDRVWGRAVACGVLGAAPARRSEQAQRLPRPPLCPRQVCGPRRRRRRAPTPPPARHVLQAPPTSAPAWLWSCWHSCWARLGTC